MKKHGRIDRNQNEIRDAVRSIGASFQTLASVGEGVPDALVGYRGVTMLWEIKSKRGELTPDQLTWRDDWQGDQPYIVRSVNDALEILDSLGVDDDHGT